MILMQEIITRRNVPQTDGAFGNWSGRLQPLHISVQSPISKDRKSYRRKVKHQDIGQMQMYVNYYKSNMLTEGDNEPIGIVLCAEKNEAVVKYTLGSDSNTHIYASKYMPYMPTEEELKKELNSQILLEQSKDDSRE